MFSHPKHKKLMNIFSYLTLCYSAYFDGFFSYLIMFIIFFLSLSVTWFDFVSSFPDQGTVQKVVVLPTNFSASGELILEELEGFQVCLYPAYTFSNVCVRTNSLF